MSQPQNTTSSSDARGTKSLMRGDLASVRLPSRMVPICVSDPMGLARPRRIAITPAIVVVLTAPRPTSMIPSFPSGLSIFLGFVTAADYTIRIIWKSGNLDLNGVLQEVSTGRPARGHDGGSQAG